MTTRNASGEIHLGQQFHFAGSPALVICRACNIAASIGAKRIAAQLPHETCKRGARCPLLRKSQKKNDGR